MTDKLLLLDPSGEIRTERRTLAPRLPSLRGLTVGIIDDCLGNSNFLLDRVGELLGEEHGVAEVLYRKKPNLSAPTPPAIFNEVREHADFVVVGLGA